MFKIWLNFNTRTLHNVIHIMVCELFSDAMKPFQNIDPKNFRGYTALFCFGKQQGQGITTLIYSMFSMHTFLIYFSNVQWHSL